MSGIECVRQLKSVLPRTPAVMLSMHPSNDCILESLQAGAAGYLIKSRVREELPTLIQRVVREEVLFTREVARRVLAHFRQYEPRLNGAVRLTPREQEVLRLISQGFSSKEISQRLGCAPNTVDRHAQHICGKLHVSGRVAAASSYFLNPRDQWTRAP
jgi:DNA-binding NarL/FixJ family response regulator